MRPTISRKNVASPVPFVSAQPSGSRTVDPYRINATETLRFSGASTERKKLMSVSHTPTVKLGIGNWAPTCNSVGGAKAMVLD